MKKSCLFAVLLVSGLLLALSGCSILMGEDGKDGKVYLEVAVYSYADAYWTDLQGISFPDYWDLYTSYEIDEGAYSVKYALCEYQYQYSSDLGDYYYFYYINSYDTTAPRYYSSTLADCTAVLDQYLNTDNGPVISYDISITVNKGTDGSILKDGKDGEDKYYSLYLGWDPDNSEISSNGAALKKTVMTGKDNLKVLQFKDKYRTFTLTFPENKTVSGTEPLPLVKAVQ
ncbi:MAG: hypothetical protein GXP33_03150 [Spirochaetes bacterium]|nr:hypothetical protein [Spirochaetota bacterium]